MLRTVATALAATALAGLAQAQDAEEALTVIHAGWLLAVPGEAPLEQQSILVRGERIEGIQAGYVTPDGATVIDLSDDYVMPGFIDSHVHLQSELGPGRRFNTFTESPSDLAFAGADNARTTLMAGFTTVQDVGGNFEAALALRDAVDAGFVPGPRMRVAGTAVEAAIAERDGAMAKLESELSETRATEQAQRIELRQEGRVAGCVEPRRGRRVARRPLQPRHLRLHLPRHHRFRPHLRHPRQRELRGCSPPTSPVAEAPTPMRSGGLFCAGRPVTRLPAAGQASKNE